MGKEHDQPGSRSEQPLQPFELPEHLAYFLKDQDYACVTHASDQGTIFIVKAPGPDIETLPGRVPIHVRHELYEHPAAPVIRTVLTIYDRPENPLALETFINVAEEDQRRDFAQLADQEELLIAFYDDDLKHRLTKRVPYTAQRVVPEILRQAGQVRARILAETYDFDRAKDAVMRATRL